MITLDLVDEFAKLSVSPEDWDAENLSAADIVGRLEASGVRYGIIDDAIANAVEQINTHRKAIKDVIVARQLESQPGEPGTVEHLVTDRQVAAPGDTIARIGTGTAPVDGKTIFGKIIEAPELPESGPAAGANAEMVGNEIKATVYGIVSSSAEEISVDLPVEVGSDDMTAFIDIHLKSAVGTPITPKMVRGSLQTAGICYGFDDERIRSVVESAAESDSSLMHMIIAEGTPAKKGQDARVEKFIETETLQGEMREDGSIDFRERHTIHNVEAGVIICRRVPPTEGEPRIDVYERSYPPESGADIVIQAGGNVEKLGDEFRATIDGALKIKNNIVAVLDVFSVAGDIDIESGNLRLSKGAVDIRGAVRSGLQVSAASDIMISGLVEDANLESGADIQISGGILHAETGSIRAAGSVTAKFAQNAKIVAGGDIVINGMAINCDLRSGAEIIVIGSKACLVGGTARAAKTIHVAQLGSDAEVATHVEICPDGEVIDMLKKKLRQIKKAIKAGEAQEADLEVLLERLHGLTITNRINATIRIDNTVFPGVSAKILNNKYTFTKENYRCKISLDEDYEISVNPLARRQ